MTSAETDNFIIENYKEDLEKLARGDYEDWKADKEGKLAAIILTDQFTRNMFRKKKEAFAYDHIALNIAKQISDDEFKTYKLQEQGFIVLPYEHSENIDDQE